MATSINDQILSKLSTLTNNKATSTSNQSSLNMQTMDWMSLLVAQLQNQDMYNSADSSEYTNQMAQYSMIQALNDLTSITEDTYATNYTSYAASLVGKEVTAAKLNDDKELVTETGTITGVTLFENEPMVYIGKNSYSLSQLMVIGKVEDSTETAESGESGESSSNPDGGNTESSTTKE